MDVYDPQEDSFLLAEQVKKYARGIVLDMGTGSGIQAINAAKCVRKVVAVDVNPNALKAAKANALKEGIKNIEFLESDIFSALNGRKFDTIIFNPPYLPADVKAKDIALDGGKKGYEVLGKFIGQVNDYLNEDGIVLFIFSSLTNKGKIDELIAENMLDFREIAMQPLFMEKLYVYILRKSNVRKELEKRNVVGIRIFAHGKRGIVYTGILGKKKIAVKVKNPKSEAINRIENEAYWLKRLNKYGIGPKFLFSGDGYIVYEFVGGEFILDYLDKASRKEAANAITQILHQMHELDKIGADKEEMHHPIKHIIVGKKPVLIDFERAHVSLHPKNVTQFCQFLSGKARIILARKGLDYSPHGLSDAARKYKESRDLGVVIKVLGIYNGGTK